VRKVHRDWRAASWHLGLRERDLGMRFAMIRDWEMMRLRRRLNLSACELASAQSQLIGCNAPGSAPRTEGNSETARETI
jgi:hypothetical protein